MTTNWARENSIYLDEFNYLRNCTPPKYFIELLPKRVNQLLRNYGESWCVVICGDEFSESDYFVIPYSLFKPFLQDRYMQPKGKAQPNPVRWLFQVRDQHLTFFPPEATKYELETTKVPIGPYYGSREAFYRTPLVSLPPHLRSSS